MFTVECCVHWTILNKLTVIIYPFEIPLDGTQHDLLSETILFGDDLYRSRVGDGLDVHILPVGGIIIKYSQHLIDSNKSTPETTIRMIFEQFSAGVVDTSLLLLMIHSQFVRNFSLAVPGH